jgi:hypothetical protein
MRRRVAFVVTTLAVFAALDSIGLTYGAIAKPRPPQQPENLECDNNYSVASDPVCVAALEYELDPVVQAWTDIFRTCCSSSSCRWRWHWWP